MSGRRRIFSEPRGLRELAEFRCSRCAIEWTGQVSTVGRTSHHAGRWPTVSVFGCGDRDSHFVPVRSAERNGKGNDRHDDEHCEDEEDDHCEASAGWRLRIDGPFMAMRCEDCKMRSKTASARVGSDIAACHFSTGSWLTTIVERSCDGPR